MWGTAQQVTDHLREATRIQNEEITTLDKVMKDLDKESANVDFGTEKTKRTKGTTSPTSTSPGKAPSLQLEKKPDAVEDDAEVKFKEARNVKDT